MEVVQACSTAAELADAERFWIVQFRALGFDLTNHTDGGDGQTGLKHTEETKARIAASVRGRKNPGAAAAHRGNKYNAGRTQTVEERQLRSRALGGRPIIDQNGRVYPTTNGACRELGLDQSHVVAVLKGRAKSTGGYVFRYVEPAHNLSA
jgi:hypothetical protein